MSLAAFLMIERRVFVTGISDVLSPSVTISIYGCWLASHTMFAQRALLYLATIFNPFPAPLGPVNIDF